MLVYMSVYCLKNSVKFLGKYSLAIGDLNPSLPSGTLCQLRIIHILTALKKKERPLEIYILIKTRGLQAEIYRKKD